MKKKRNSMYCKVMIREKGLRGRDKGMRNDREKRSYQEVILEKTGKRVKKRPELKRKERKLKGGEN